MKIRELTKISMCVALLCISAYISIPLPFTPAMITCLTIVVNLSGLIMSPKKSFLTLLIYILIGAIGVPVFVGGTAGLGKIFGPTGGFIFGYLIAAPTISILKGKDNNFIRYILVTALVGAPIIYVCGTISMVLVQNVSIMQALFMSVFPFIVGDFIKCILASFIAIKLNKVLNNEVVNA